MSAITAIYNLDQAPVERSDMIRQLEVLAHRGSDGHGVYIDKNIGLGQRIRWVTPESKLESLPMKSGESSAVIICDARLDNRGELMRQLLFRKPADQITDSDIILKAYEKWGTDFVPKLLGDFVFAIWDPNEQKLFAARDSMGVKHFYYYYEPGVLFALASEPKALLCLPGVSNEIDTAHIGDLLILNYNDKESTAYKGIKRLPANSALVVDSRGLRIWKYWAPKATTVTRSRSNKDYEEEFRALFREAVTCRMRSPFKVGSMLSGGLDSSSISSVASEYLSKKGQPPLETFSAIFPTISEIDSRIDERTYIQQVVDHIRCEPNFVVADNFSPLKDMRLMQWHADHPIGVPNVFMDWALFKAAEAKQVRVLLSGFDGDSTVSYGYEALPELARTGRWFRMIKDARGLNRNMPQRQHNIKKLIWNRGFRPAIPEFVRRGRRVLAGRPKALPINDALPSVHAFPYGMLNADFVERFTPRERYFSLVEQEYPSGTDHASEWWNALCNGLFAFALETFEKLSAAVGVEPRFPFFDRRLIEFCISLPAEQRLYGGWTRSIFRRAMTGILPPEVQWRTDKANIGLSFKLNLLKYGRKDVETAVFGSGGSLGTFLDFDKLADAYRRYEKQPMTMEGEPMILLSATYLSSWIRANAASVSG